MLEMLVQGWPTMIVTFSIGYFVRLALDAVGDGGGPAPF